MEDKHLFIVHYTDNGKEKGKETTGWINAKSLYWRLKCQYYDVWVEEVGIGMIDECEL